MWKLTFLILLFYELPIFCFGQQVYKLADTILVNQMLQEADTLSKQKKFSAAIAKQERARLILEQIFTKTSKQVIAVMAQIGANYFYMGEPDKAINNYEKILTLKTALAETDTSDWNLQEIYFSLGFAYARQGAYDTSMENYEKALAIATKKWGATDKKTLYYWQEQGINYAATGRYEQAGKYFQKALDIAINSFKYQPAVASRIVHLATHGKANDKVGDYSFLAFTELKDSVDNELLYVRDIYNLRLNADLVVLSACETGIGELRRGEGVVSLARAFAYSGAKSLITTLWNVDDRSTMLIMTDFYKNLKKGRPKDLSLWQAKQEYLQESRNKTAHPYFWSAFIPIGDMKAIKN